MKSSNIERPTTDLPVFQRTLERRRTTGPRNPQPSSVEGGKENTLHNLRKPDPSSDALKNQSGKPSLSSRPPLRSLSKAVGSFTALQQSDPSTEDTRSPSPRPPNTAFFLTLAMRERKTEKKICKQFLHNGTCSYGSRCLFYHEDPSPLAVTVSSTTLSTRDSSSTATRGTTTGSATPAALPLSNNIVTTVAQKKMAHEREMAQLEREEVPTPPSLDPRLEFGITEDSLPRHSSPAATVSIHPSLRGHFTTEEEKPNPTVQEQDGGKRDGGSAVPLSEAQINHNDRKHAKQQHLPDICHHIQEHKDPAPEAGVPPTPVEGDQPPFVSEANGSAFYLPSYSWPLVFSSSVQNAGSLFHPFVTGTSNNGGGAPPGVPVFQHPPMNIPYGVPVVCHPALWPTLFPATYVSGCHPTAPPSSCPASTTTDTPAPVFSQFSTDREPYDG